VALIDIETARSLVLQRVRATEPEDVPLRAAGERRLAATAVAAVDVPGFDNSAMDGFAVRAADTAGAAPDSPRELRIAGEARAGAPAAVAAGAGEAIAISTGAMVPDGAGNDPHSGAATSRISNADDAAASPSALA